MKHAIFRLDPHSSPLRTWNEMFAGMKSIAGPKKLILEPGIYHLNSAESIPREMAISNTLTYGIEPWRNPALLLENIDDLTIEGNDAELRLDGNLTALTVINCRYLQIRNLKIDYIRPRVSEMTVINVRDTYADFKIGDDSAYCIDSEKNLLAWLAADGSLEDHASWQIVQCANARTGTNLRNSFNPVQCAKSVETIGPQCLRFRYTAPPPVETGEIWQFRNPLRDQNGIVLDHCNQVTLHRLHLCFTPGLGVIAQNCSNILLEHCCHAPQKSSGRFCAAAADSMHFCCCRGDLEIANCFFSGTQDDPINVHGIYWAVEQVSGKNMLLKFMHPETWGVNPFRSHDQIALSDRNSLLRFAQNNVISATMPDPLHIRLELADEFPHTINWHETVVENMNAYPDVSIHHSHFTNYPTRGILITSAGTSKITHNVFASTSRMPAIFVAGDANSWYESGGVGHLEIVANKFYNCTTPAILIQPEIASDQTGNVHNTILIRENQFSNCIKTVLQYSSVQNLITDLDPSQISATKISKP